MKFIFLLTSFLSINFLFSQSEVPTGYFRSPMDVNLYLSGTFGEPRTTHFHTGIDIKTQGVEGKNIYAVANGYISRISVSPYGYGNALYITHPNGYVSVYGHLQKFNDKIDTWFTQKQKEQTIFQLNIENIDPSIFPLKQGEFIAKSGNSGGSGGPHLHFEIRDAEEHPINPLLFGYDKKITDNAKPALYNLFLYNLDESKAYAASKKLKTTAISSGSYQLNAPVIVNTDEIGLGIHTVDLFTGTSNKNGVYDIKMYDDGILCYHYKVDELDFNYTKHVYSHCDYWEKRSNNSSVHKCFVEKGNQLKVYPTLTNNGIIILSDNNTHNMKIEVSDFHGNTSTLNFQLKKDMSKAYFTKADEVYETILFQGQNNFFVRDNITINFPKEVLFDDVYFKYEEKEIGDYSNQYTIHDSKEPLANYFSLAIKLKNIDSTLLDKYLIAYKDYNNRTKYVGGQINKDFIEGSTRAYGIYYVDVDTTAPKISPVNIYNNKNMRGSKEIQIKASDNFSGIEEYNAFVNGKWVILAYDAKRALFTYTIDENVLKGKNEITFIIKDDRDNATNITYNFTY